MPRAKLILQVVSSDNTFARRKLADSRWYWVGKCIHCRSKLTVTDEGELTEGTTLEHIVPKNHGGDDQLSNLSLACARCNHGKGMRLDHRPMTDPTLQRVIAKLKARRQARWRDPAKSDENSHNDP